MVFIQINGEKCKSCELCVVACPKKIMAISTDAPNSKGYYPAQVSDREACTGCASCARTCPDGAIRIEKE